MSKINQIVAQQIIDEFCEGRSSFDLADKHGLWQTSICNLISGRTWKQCIRPDNIKELIKSRHDKGLFEKGRVCHIDAPPLTELQMDILVGSLLGDGSLGKQNINGKFSKTQHKDRIEYLNWHLNLLKPYSSKILTIFSDEKLVGDSDGNIIERIKVNKFLSGYNFYTHQHPVFTDLYKQWYPIDKKIVPNNLELNPQRIAIWYFDDGSNCFESRTAVICTQSFTLEEAAFLCEKLKLFNLTPTIAKIISSKTGREMPILKFYSSSYDNLINLVKPYCLWDCFKYKTEWRKAKEQWEYSGKFTLEQISEIKELRKNISARQIADMFNVHVNTIYAIVSGRSWSFI